MEDLPPWLPFAGLALAAVVAYFVTRRLERGRTEALAQAALRLGMTFRPEDEALATAAFTGLPIFQRGHSRKWTNVASGSSHHVFEFRYTEGSGKSSTTHHQTVAVFELASRRLPRFELKPEGLAERLGSVLGGQDIDFEDDPAFSRRYHLKGPDEAAIRQTFHAGLRQQLAAERGWWLEGEGQWLALYRRRKRVRPDDLAEFLESARRIAALLG